MDDLGGKPTSLGTPHLSSWDPLKGYLQGGPKFNPYKWWKGTEANFRLLP